MRVRIELSNREEETVIYCRRVTPEIESLARKISEEKTEGQFTAFFKGDQQYFLQFSEILFFETGENLVYAHTKSDSYETKDRLYELERRLPGSFIRVSKSCIANIQNIFSIQRSLARVGLISFRDSHKEIYVSRTYIKTLQVKMEERHLYEKL